MILVDSVFTANSNRGRILLDFVSSNMFVMVLLRGGNKKETNGEGKKCNEFIPLESNKAPA